MVEKLKRVLFWNYGRSTWQYDILCLLILAFIFLTPRTWFESSELRSMGAHHTQSSMMLIIAGLEDDMTMDREEIKRRVEAVVKHPVTVRSIRPQHNKAGQVVAFEVDIQ
ncbi:MAG: hypothetical protein WKF84_17460 [Pyrinomonadaceae bacterium]